MLATDLCQEKVDISNVILKIRGAISRTMAPTLGLTSHNCQKMKKVDSFTCLYHKIYRDEAVGLKGSKYTFKKIRFS